MKQMRARAYNMLFERKCNVTIQRLSDVSNGTFSRIERAYLANYQDKLDKLLDPKNLTAGDPLRLSKNNELRVCTHLKDAAERWFAVDLEGIHDVAARVT